MGEVHYEGDILDIDQKHGESMPNVFEKIKKKEVKHGNNPTDTNECAN